MILLFKFLWFFSPQATTWHPAFKKKKSPNLPPLIEFSTGIMGNVVQTIQNFIFEVFEHLMSFLYIFEIKIYIGGKKREAVSDY